MKDTMVVYLSKVENDGRPSGNEGAILITDNEIIKLYRRFVGDEFGEEIMYMNYSENSGTYIDNQVIREEIDNDNELLNYAINKIKEIADKKELSDDDTVNLETISVINISEDDIDDFMEEIDDMEENGNEQKDYENDFFCTADHNAIDSLYYLEHKELSMDEALKYFAVLDDYTGNDYTILDDDELDELLEEVESEL